MHKNSRIKLIALVIAIIALLGGVWLYAARNEKPASGEKSIAAVAADPSEGLLAPPLPVGTYQAPTLTPDPHPPAQAPLTPPPLPPPPPTVDLNPGGSQPAPVASMTAQAGEKPASTGSLVAWGVETSGSLTIWVGTYSDTPGPGISGAKAVARWNVSPALKLRDLAFSPDGNSLAVLTIQPYVGNEGDYPTWLYVINLNNGVVQHLPDYGQYDLYSYSFIRSRDKIIGWIDNTKLAIQQGNEYAAVIATTNGTTTYQKVTFSQPELSAIQTTLSPDRKTFFSVAEGYWLYGLNGSNAQKIVDVQDSKMLFNPEWSPADNYISFLSPVAGANGTDLSNMALWVLDLSDNTHKEVSSGNVWGLTVPWSFDGSTIAFLSADLPVSDATAKFDQPEKVNTNIVTVNSDLKLSNLTSFSGARIKHLAWTPGGNLIVSSNVGSTSDALGIVAVLGADGTAVTLISASSGESLVRPVVFNAPGSPMGNPHAMP